MTATVLKFPHERINAEPRQCEAKILQLPQQAKQLLLRFNPAVFCWEWVWL